METVNHVGEMVKIAQAIKMMVPAIASKKSIVTTGAPGVQIKLEKDLRNFFYRYLFD